MNNAKQKRKRRKIRPKMIAFYCISIFIILILLLNVVVINIAKPLIVTAEEAAGIFNDTEGMADCILVLGASVTPNGPSLILADRLDKGMELFELGVSNIMLLSGDNGTVEYNEVQVMKEYALRNGGDLGLEAANIYLDYAGFSTYDSAKRCKEVFQAERVVIVTQRYHLYRAVYNAKMVGIDVIGVAANDRESRQWLRDFRELPARVKDFFLTHIGYVPKIMGDPIPLEYPSTY